MQGAFLVTYYDAFQLALFLRIYGLPTTPNIFFWGLKHEIQKEKFKEETMEIK